MDLAAWAKRAAGEHAAAMRRLDRLPATGKLGTKVPFPHVDREELRKGIDDDAIADAIRAAEVVDVPLAGLGAIQQSVDAERVARYILDPGAPSKKSSVPTDVPIVVERGGERAIWDGHHRCTAAKLKGEDSIRARLVDLGKLENKS